MKATAGRIQMNKIVITGLMTIFLISCSTDLKHTKKADPFFEKWSTMAENSKGSSPDNRPKIINLDKAPVAKAPSAAFIGDMEKRLPDQTNQPDHCARRNSRRFCGPWPKQLIIICW